MSNAKIKELTQEKTKEIVDAINRIENKEIMVNVSRAKIKPEAEFVFLPTIIFVAKRYKEGKRMNLTPREIVKELDNEHDSEAIKVEMDGLGKVGYVANSVHTVLGDCYSAGRLYEKVKDNAEGAHVPDISARGLRAVS